MAYKRNFDKHTDQDLMRLRILRALKNYGAVTQAPHHYLLSSGLGYSAYPDYDFKNPQAAAFAVAKVKRQLVTDGFIWHRHYGYYITFKGEAHLANLEAANEQLPA